VFSEEQIQKIKENLTWGDVNVLSDLLLAIKGLKLVVELEPDRNGNIRACRVYFGNFYKTGQWYIKTKDDIINIAKQLTDEVVISVIENLKDILAETIDSE